MEAVRACWASLWTARAMAYRRRQGIDPATVSLAVVVQRMVAAEAAGIMFTADPVGGRRDRMVINAAWGLGEAVVGGEVTPDTLVVEQGDGRVISRETADKSVMTVLTANGTEERPVPEARRRRPVLDDETAAELARYGARIEDHYGAPQDIEWALADGELSILQARPITNLPPADVRWDPPIPGSAWWRRQVVENLPEPLSPLFDELYLREGLELSIDTLLAFFGMTYLRLEDVVDRPIFATVNGYAYSRADYRLGWRTAPKLLRALFDELRDTFRGRDDGLLARAGAARLPGEGRAVEGGEPGRTRPTSGSWPACASWPWRMPRYWFACALMIGRAKVTDGAAERLPGGGGAPPRPDQRDVPARLPVSDGGRRDRAGGPGRGDSRLGGAAEPGRRTRRPRI